MPEKKTPKKIYISWNYTTHGIAYLKHVLSAFFIGKASLKDKFIKTEALSQDDMNAVFDQHTDEKKGFLFDKVYFLYFNDEVTQQISSRYHPQVNTASIDEVYNATGTTEIWQETYDKDKKIKEELSIFKQKYTDKYELLLSQYWRAMQHYLIDDQLFWFTEMSNAKKFYVDSKRFEPVRMDEITDSHDPVQIARSVQKLLKEVTKKYPDAEYVINVSLGNYEAQNVWYVLAEANMLPQNTRFITTYDPKNNRNARFKPFVVSERLTKIVSHISEQFNVYEATSKSRQLAFAKMQSYIKQGFSILILGERGTGKSHLVEETITEFKKNTPKYPFASANCASFDDDTKAETELFGYVSGSFTGAQSRGKDGLFQQAKGGVLFLDEVHHLSKLVQGKLMKATQTNQKNEFQVRKFGSTTEETIKCTLIFASNQPLKRLKELLLPDFFDRISQLVVEFPPLRESREDIKKDWENIWKQLRFEDPTPNERDLFAWLKGLDLYGNYRDLQKIAIAYKSFLSFDESLRKLLEIKTPLAFAQKEFERYHNTHNPQGGDDFVQDCIDNFSDLQAMQENFKLSVIERLEEAYGLEKEEIFKRLDISQPTYYNIKKNAKLKK
jgi:transcriptional regulator with PAS, ATPase and Fis domain